MIWWVGWGQCSATCFLLVSWARPRTCPALCKPRVFHPAGGNRCPCDCGKSSLVLSEVPGFGGSFHAVLTVLCWILEGIHLSDPQSLLLHGSLLLHPANLGPLHSEGLRHHAWDSRHKSGQSQGSHHPPASHGVCSLVLDVLCSESSHFMHFIWFCLFSFSFFGLFALNLFRYFVLGGNESFVCVCVFFK